ncbi:uncharacterized protein I206_101569 [Kwoniella pini CBS 10737]|uniref:Uncharacterized protein n=1 Tax=Kwoniella pini CBS 10737 TaxID=1296096 RepID=A0A1B9HWE0_9TREE|nr:uncharacterized protein I206_06461 [Kwoniella pini CBS 10737]OCF47558.1 hypothetical protein I206_06461 [Kwoniella pini CBS 10737]
MVRNESDDSRAFSEEFLQSGEWSPYRDPQQGCAPGTAGVERAVILADLTHRILSSNRSTRDQDLKKVLNMKNANHTIIGEESIDTVLTELLESYPERIEDTGNISHGDTISADGISSVSLRQQRPSVRKRVSDIEGDNNGSVDDMRTRRSTSGSNSGGDQDIKPLNDPTSPASNAKYFWEHQTDSSMPTLEEDRQCSSPSPV